MKEKALFRQRGRFLNPFPLLHPELRINDTRPLFENEKLYLMTGSISLRVGNKGLKGERV